MIGLLVQSALARHCCTDDRQIADAITVSVSVSGWDVDDVADERADPEPCPHLSPGGDGCAAGALGDMCEPPTDGPFGCVLIAFSTLFLLPDQASQRRCLNAAAARLAPGGALVVEGFVPDPDRWNQGHSLQVEHWLPDSVVLTAGRLDPVNQSIETLRITHTAQGTTVIPNRLRYVLPAELDLLAEHAGLQFAGHYADLTGSPLPDRPSTAVSVYTAP
ncbi:hypothetical protein [Dactylosporangium sp. NPDC000521]|uniref:hypothetical protein n=1 Tax=Dactylosporangium sp. NPDC000521 TaxID=3363975 RepID=UPI0036AB090A